MMTWRCRVPGDALVSGRAEAIIKAPFEAVCELVKTWDHPARTESEEVPGEVLEQLDETNRIVWGIAKLGAAYQPRSVI